MDNSRGKEMLMGEDYSSPSRSLFYYYYKYYFYYSLYIAFAVPT